MRSFLFLLFASCFTSSQAQYKWGAGAIFYPGFLYAHTPDALNLEAHTKGFELSLAKINNSDKVWSKYYKNAEIAFDFLYIDLGKPHLTGKVYAIGTNFQFRVAGNDKNQLAIRLGTGFGYLTERFDFYKNRSNMAIGSHLNGNIQFAFLYQTLLTPRLKLKAGFGGTHYSNGSIKVPNLGVNIPSLFLGLQMGFDNSAKKLIDSTKEFKTTKKRHEVLLNYAYKERYTAKPIPFNIISAGYRWVHHASAIRRWHLGADLVYDATHPYDNDLTNPYPRVAIDNSTEFGVLIGHRFDVGRFGMITDVGFYLLNPYQTKFFTYQRIAFRYELTKNLFANVGLKIHFGIADYFEWGLGYKFGKVK